MRAVHLQEGVVGAHLGSCGEALMPATEPRPQVGPMYFLDTENPAGPSPAAPLRTAASQPQWPCRGWPSLGTAQARQPVVLQLTGKHTSGHCLSGPLRHRQAAQTATHRSRDLRLPMEVPPPAGSAPWPKSLFAYRSLGRPALPWRQSTHRSPSRSRVQLMLLLMM